MSVDHAGEHAGFADAPCLAPSERVSRVLREGELRVEGRLRTASNATLFATATLDGESLTCVYKPIAGERPLWDFPDGTLAGREVAAYQVSEAIGWHVVPPTVMRAEGPFGPGMCQRWIDVPDADAEVNAGAGSESEFEENASAPGDDADDAARAVPRVLTLLPPEVDVAGWLSIVEVLVGSGGEGSVGETAVLAHRDDPILARIAAFDVVINNADRKGGHLLAVPGHVYAIDHGVTFHVEDKLRTLLWGFAGRELPAEVRASLTAFAPRLAAGSLRATLREFLAEAEIDAAVERLGALLAANRYPLPPDDRHAIPWPPI